MKNKNQSLASQVFRRKLFNLAWLPLALYVIGAGLESAFAAQTATLALSGEAAPDGNGVYSNFSFEQTLNANGEVAFICEFTGTQNPATDSRGICLASTNSVKRLVHIGETVPDGNGTFNHFSSNFDKQEFVFLNDNGTVAFMAGLNGTSGGEADNFGSFRASAIGGVTQFVRAGDSAPDGNGVFAPGESGLSQLGLDNNNAAMFHGRFINTSGGEYIDDSGVFRSDGNTISRLIRAGETVPGGADPIEDIPPFIASNLDGQVAASVSLAFDSTGDPPGPDLQRIYVHTGAVLNEVFRGGTPVPDGNGIVTNPFDFSTNINGNVIFIGNVSDSGDYRLDVPRLFITDGVTLKQIAQQNQLAPGEQTPQGELPFRFGGFFKINRDSNAAGKVVFSMTLERSVAPPENLSSAIYLADGDTTKLILHQGDPVPGGNGTFGNIDVPLFLNNNGAIAFSAPLLGTADPVNDIRGIFYIGSNGVVQTVARNGMPLAGSTILWTGFLGEVIDNFEQFQMPGSVTALAGMDAINDAGQVVFRALLADGRFGIFLWNASDVPPPDDETIYADGFE
jgi:hypothetical protein